MILEFVWKIKTAQNRPLCIALDSEIRKEFSEFFL